MGSTVANLSISGLQKEVLITLRNTEPIPVNINNINTTTTQNRFVLQYNAAFWSYSLFPSQANYVASCVFWDFGLNGINCLLMFLSLPNRLFVCFLMVELCILTISYWFTDGSGGWNPSGCRVLNTSAEETQCACSHLTSFGILLVSYITKNLHHGTYPCLILNLACYICIIIVFW